MIDESIVRKRRGSEGESVSGQFTCFPSPSSSHVRRDSTVRRDSGLCSKFNTWFYCRMFTQKTGINPF